MFVCVECLVVTVEIEYGRFSEDVLNDSVVTTAGDVSVVLISVEVVVSDSSIAGDVAVVILEIIEVAVSVVLISIFVVVSDDAIASDVVVVI